MKAKGILFDFDGVIGNTMEDNYKAWLYALGLFEATFTKEEYFLQEGKKVAEIAKFALTKNNKDPKHGDAVAKAKDEYYNNNNQFSFADGVTELLAELKLNNIPFGLVSGGARKRIVTSKTEPVLKDFTALVTADDCVYGKPHPEPYLKGAEKLSLTPAECIVIENAPMGVESAKEAGMYCIAVCTTLTPIHLKKANLILPNFLSLLDYLKISEREITVVRSEKEQESIPSALRGT